VTLVTLYGSLGWQNRDLAASFASRARRGRNCQWLWGV